MQVRRNCQVLSEQTSHASFKSMYSPMKSFFNFSYLDPDYPIFGGTVTGLERVYCVFKRPTFNIPLNTARHLRPNATRTKARWQLATTVALKLTLLCLLGRQTDECDQAGLYCYCLKLRHVSKQLLASMCPWKTKPRGLSPRANHTWPRDRRLSAKLVQTFVHRESHGFLRPYSWFSRPEQLLFLPSSSSIVLTRLSV
jgi:hypothetical protein